MALSTDTLYSERSDTATVQRILIIVIGVVLVSFLTSSSTLVLAIYNISARNIPKATNCACDAVQDRTHSREKFTELSQPSKEKVSAFLNESAVENKIMEIEDMKKKYEQLQAKCNTSALFQSIKVQRIELMQEIMQLNQKVLNISLIQGPRGFRGPPGYNGTRGSPGLNGTQGIPGTSPTGGDLTLCSYQERKGTEVSTGSYAFTDVSVNETNGNKIIGANCASNDAKVVLLSSFTSGGTRKYQCDCSGTQNTGVSRMYCSIHYWEC